MTELGFYPTTRIIKNHVIKADQKIAMRMGVEIGSDVIELERLRYIKEEPFVLIASYLPYNICPEIVNIDLTGKSLLAVLKKEYGIVLVSSKRSIEATIANDYESKILKVRKGSPLLLFNSSSFMEGGAPAGTTKALFRGDRARFDVEVAQINGKE